MGESEQIFYLKHILKKRYVMELSITRVCDSRYTDGVKYSLVFVESLTKKMVLMDNHHPKGPHFHLDRLQFDYIYRGDEQLIEDFKTLVLQHFGIEI